MEALGGVKIFHAATRVEDHKLLTTGGRVMGVTAIAEDLPSAIQRAYAGVNKLQFEGMHYRKDIGAKALRRVPKPPGSQTSARRQGESARLRASSSTIQEVPIPIQILREERKDV